ncbi:MAG: prolyl oligopeptidase family serine peptidase [Myxococcota bacterium]
MRNIFKLTISLIFILFLSSQSLLSEPIPSSVLFSPPKREFVKISPDGEKISYISRDGNNVKNIFIRTVGKNDDREIIKELDSDINFYEWANDSNTLLFLKKTEDKKGIHLYSINIKNGIIRDLTPFNRISAKFLITDVRIEDEVVCGLELNQRGRFDLFIINLKNGAIAELAQSPDDVIDFKGDIKNRIFIAETFDRKTLKKIFKIKTPSSEKFTDLLTVGPLEEFRIVDFSEDGRSLFALSNLSNEFLSLIKFDIESKKEVETIATFEKSDIDNLFFNHYNKRAISVAYDFMKRDISVLDTDAKPDIDLLLKMKKGTLTLIGTDKKNEKWLISFESFDIPASYYIYNRIHKKASLLFLSNPEFEKYKPIRSQPFTIKFKEKEKLLLFVTLPPDESAENYPMILNLYNNGNLKRGQIFDPFCQFFTSRGFACISFNYSGINGFGKKFYKNAYTKDGIERRTEEIVTVIKWAIDRNIAHPQQISILSDSLNSLYSLNAIIENSDIIHTAIFIDPLLNNSTIKNNIDIDLLHNYRELLMIPFDEKADYLSSLKSISIPSIFMFHKHSALYNYKQLSDILIAAKNKNKDIQIISFPNISDSNLIDFFSRVEAFVARFYNTDYIEMKQDSKSEAEVR